MNKLKSFGAALVLLLVFVLIVNGLFERGSLKMDNRDRSEERRVGKECRL